MDTIIMRLRSNYHEEFEIILQTEKESDYFDIPSGKDVVYNDNSYSFVLPDISIPPSKVYINDEAYDIDLQKSQNAEDIVFKLKNCNQDKPFLQSFGAIKIEVDIDGIQYHSKSIAVMVSNDDINVSVLNMIEYIYNNCEKYLYEEHKYSSILSGIKENEIISIEAKIAFLQQTLKVYKQSYQYLKTNPYSKLTKIENVDSFEKLQSVTPRTIQFITNNIDELTAVNYDTGIRIDGQYYQPKRTLVERNAYSYDVYENKIIIGFLETLVSEINTTIKALLEKTYLKNRASTSSKYIDSMFHIFSRSIKKINGYIDSLYLLQKEYRQIYYFYIKLFQITPETVQTVPKFTPVFRSIIAYRQIYIVIHNWFSIGNYDLGKDELLLSFISTSKIYEYYCLIKILRYLNDNSNMKLIESKHVAYSVKNTYYVDTHYNNTFRFEGETVKLTVYFQPVIYADDKSVNGICLFRNTSSSSKSDNEFRGYIYTPDYIIKIDYGNKTDYLLLDAKFSTPDNIRFHQLQELVYKYLFSISILNKEDRLLGLYILCGKKQGSDAQDVIHDIAQKIKRAVTPFAEILVMNGVNTDDYTMVAEIAKSITIN